MEKRSKRIIRVIAPSRLHFGMFSFGQPGARQFGGVGAMIDRPSLRLHVSASSALTVTGPMADRAREFAERWSAFHRRSPAPACDIQVLDAPREHVGLGAGTQLALSIGAALNAFFKIPPCSPAELAISVRRGNRSAIGTYGFAGGGLIAEKGKLEGEPVAPLDCRVDMSADWRFVIICLAGTGLSGMAEQSAFDQLPPVPENVTRELASIASESLFPAATMGDFETFSEGLFRFGRVAGKCFAAQQGGPYNGPQLANLVGAIQALGVRGVGQSSWGPTLFAVTRSEADAAQLSKQILERFALGNDEIWIAAPNNQGAVIEVEE